MAGERKREVNANHKAKEAKLQEEEDIRSLSEAFSMLTLTEPKKATKNPPTMEEQDSASKQKKGVVQTLHERGSKSTTATSKGFLFEKMQWLNLHAA